MKVHVDVVGRDEDGEHAEGQGDIVFIAEGCFDAVLVAVGETIGGYL